MVKNVIIAALCIALGWALFFRAGNERKRTESAPVSPAKPASPPERPVPEPERARAEPERTVDRFDPLRERLAESRQLEALSGTAIGFCLIDAANGNVYVDDNAHTAFIPASTLKTLTTATALEVFGPEFRIETRLDASEPAAEGTINGDLIFVGGGDPTLSIADLKTMAAELKAQGVKTIGGRVIGDGRGFGGSTYADHWSWGDIGNGYGSPVSGLNLERNRYRATFRPGTALDAPATFSGAEPEVPAVKWSNQVTTGPAGSGDGVVIYGGERTDLVHLRGTVPLDHPEFTVLGAVPNPERFATHHLRKALLDAGIEVNGEATTVSFLADGGEAIPAGKHKLLTHKSAPLIDIVTHIHKVSDNHESECLFRLLDQRDAGAFVRGHWRERGLNFEGLRMVDGCGLARANHVRPIDLARLQFLAAGGPAGEEYKASLLHTKDGSVRWKGGAMSGVRSYAGYIRGRTGGEFCFALMVNHFSDSKPVSQLREALMELMKEL